MHSWKALTTVLTASALFFAGCMADPAQETHEATMAPGSTASLPMIVNDAPWDLDAVTMSIQEAAGFQVTTTSLHDTGNDTLAGWVSFEAPAQMEPGDHTVTILVESGEGEERTFDYVLSVETPDPTIQEGEQATLHVTGRTMDGELVLTTQSEIADARLPHHEGYQEPMQTEPIPLTVMHGGQLPEEIVAALLASGEGHTVTVTVQDFFGPSEMEDQQPREEALPRTDEQQRVHEFPRQQAEQQGIIEPDAQEGDVLEFPGLPFPYVIHEFQEDPQHGELVVIHAQVEEGQSVTLHEQWPESAVVTEIDDDTVHLRIDPPHEQGEAFTWNPVWPDATEIVHMDDESIVLRHSPEEGMTYTEPGQQPGQEIEATVVEVTEEHITISRDNPDPLGGQTILLEVTILEVGEPEGMGMEPGPQQPGPAP